MSHTRRPAREPEPSGQPREEAPGLSRRALFGATGAGILAVGLAGAGGYALGSDTNPPPADGAVDFFGAHQPGIVTAQQDHLHFAAFDVTASSRDGLAGLLRDWSAAAATLMAGRELGLGSAGGSPHAPADDTGEALGLPPSRLTLTFGFGRGLFERDGQDRFGLRSRLPEALIDLPHFAGDELDPASSGGDLCVQACADDPQVAVHAVRNLARLGLGRAALRWTQSGFGRTSSTTRDQQTPRNLMGFKDGTNNLRAEQGGMLDSHVWVPGSESAGWMAGGTYLVARRIRILTDAWDRAPLGEQERMVGRTKGTGAPLSGGDEFTPVDFERRGRGSEPLIPHNSHVGLTHPSRSGVHMLRRGYNFTDGADELGRMVAGLFFIVFVRDPGAQFVPLQHTLSRSDRMTTAFLRTTGSALFAVPPGVAPGSPLGEGGAFVGEALLA